MIENQSIWKKGNMDHHPDHDLLSDLPLSIIHIILAFIPIREAVRTCILSRQWRYIWTSLPHLVFDNRCASEEDESESKYEDFINRVLFRHKGPIHEFKVSCSPEFSNVEEWIFCLARNGIRELTLDMEYYDVSGWVEMHSSIYSCKKLTYLELYRCKINPPPLTFKGFLFLRCLELNTVRLSPDEIRSLVSICPLLERFSLTQLKQSELQISTPNLKYLYLYGDFEKICIYAPLLTEISVGFNKYKGLNKATRQQLKVSACDYANCFGGFTNLQKLSGTSYFTKYLSFGIQFCHHSLAFHHLKFIDLECVNFEDVKEILVVSHLVIGAPNLHKLIIEIESYKCEHDASDAEALHMSFMDLVCGSNFKLEKLTEFSLSYLTGQPLELDFLKFLLESSPVLEKMTLDISLEISTEEKQKLRAELLGFSRASPNVKLWMTNPDDLTDSLVLLHLQDDSKPVAEALS